MSESLCQCHHFNALRSGFWGKVARSVQVSALDNGLALTPPMGWMTWERYGCQIDEQMIRAMADRMAEVGLGGPRCLLLARMAGATPAMTT